MNHSRSRKPLAALFLLAFATTLSWASSVQPAPGCIAMVKVFMAGHGPQFSIQCFGTCEKVDSYGTTTKTCVPKTRADDSAQWCGNKYCTDVFGSEPLCCHMTLTGFMHPDGTFRGTGLKADGTCLACPLSGACTAVDGTIHGVSGKLAECITPEEDAPGGF